MGPRANLTIHLGRALAFESLARSRASQHRYVTTHRCRPRPQAFDERALARYRWLVQHEHELTADQQLELQHYRMRSSTRNFHPLEATMVDYNRWSDADLHRYRQLLTRAIDAEVLPELALTDDELRELERYRLGLVERIDDHTAYLCITSIPGAHSLSKTVAHRTSRHWALDPRLARPISARTRVAGPLTRTRSSRTASEATTRTVADT